MVTWGQTINLDLGGDSTNSTLLTNVFADLSFSISQLGPGSLSLLQLGGGFPAGVTAVIPYAIPLPATGPPGPFTVTFTLTIADITNTLTFETASTVVTIN